MLNVKLRCVMLKCRINNKSEWDDFAEDHLPNREEVFMNGVIVWGYEVPDPDEYPCIVVCDRMYAACQTVHKICIIYNKDLKC